MYDDERDDAPRRPRRPPIHDHAAADRAREEQFQARRQRAAEQKEAGLRRAREMIGDPATRAGDDPAAVQATAAWLRTNRDALTFRAQDGPARDALLAASSAIAAEVATRDAEIAAARSRAGAEDVLRHVRGEPPVAIPAPFDVRALIDPDAVGRWLARHAGGFTLVVGRRWRTEYTGPGGLTSGIEQPPGWDHIRLTHAAWTAWARLEGLAATHPADATGLHALGLRALAFLDQRDDQGQPTAHHWHWFATYSQVADADDRAAHGLISEALAASSTFDPPELTLEDDEEAEAEPRTEARGGRRKPIEPPTYRDRVRRFVKRFRKEHNRGPSKKEMRDGVTGRDATIIATVDEMVADGELIVETRDGQPAYRIGDE